MLRSRHPMFLWWGPELIQLYNDAYVPSFGSGKHPRAMGQRGRECWPEIWSIIGPQIDDVMLRGKASWNEDQLVPILRNGRIEEVFWTYGYSPVCDEDGNVAGTLVVCTETTSRVIAARRLGILKQLSIALEGCHAVGEIARATLGTLERHAPDDVSFAGWCPWGRDASGNEIVPAAYDVEFLERIREAGRAFFDPPGAERVIAFPNDGHAPPHAPEPSRELFLAPLGQGRALALGVSPRIPLDRAYREFLGALAGDVRTALERVEAAAARNAVEVELRTVSARLEAAQSAGGVGLFEWTIAGDAPSMYWSPEIYALLGLESGEVAASAEAWSDRIHEEDRSRGWEAYEHAVRAGRRAFEIEVRMRLPNGSVRWVRTTSRFSYDDRGVPRSLLGAVVDTTPQHDALDSERHARAAAERASNFAELFVGVIGHDLRNPLSAIQTGAAVLARAAKDERDARVAGGVSNSAQRIARMIDQILDFSRIRVGAGPQCRPVPADLAATLSRARDELMSCEGALGKTLHLEVAGVTTGVWDEARIEQVLSNLLGNALQHSPPGSAVHVKIDGRADDLVEVTVRSPGSIPPATVPTLFEPFQQGRQLAKARGLGLGLFITREIVSGHGGSIEVSSTPPPGETSFIVRLQRSPSTTPRAS